MTSKEQTLKLKEEREKFLNHAKIRLKNLKKMRADISAGKNYASKKIQREIDDWFVRLDINISLAGTEVELIESSAGKKWKKICSRAEEAIASAERELKRGYEILKTNTPAA